MVVRKFVTFVLVAVMVLVSLSVICETASANVNASHTFGYIYVLGAGWVYNEKTNFYVSKSSSYTYANFDGSNHVNTKASFFVSRDGKESVYRWQNNGLEGVGVKASLKRPDNSVLMSYDFTFTDGSSWYNESNTCLFTIGAGNVGGTWSMVFDWHVWGNIENSQRADYYWTSSSSFSYIGVPGPPRSLQGTGGDRSATLAWGTPINDGGSQLTGYCIYYGTSSGSTKPDYPYAFNVGVQNSYSGGGLTNGVTYYFRAAAVNAKGIGDLSNEVSVTPFYSGPSPPGPPTNLQATPGNAQVSLSWSAPADNGGATITDYIAYIGTASHQYTSYVDAHLQTQTTVGYLTNGVTYYFAVTAWNSAGEGSPSNEASATPSAPNEAPTVVLTSPTSNPTYSTSSSTISLGGTASDDVGVTSVTWSNDRGGSGTASGTTSWSISGITLYSGINVLTVTAHDAGSLTGADTLTVTYTPPNHPPAVTITSPTSSPTYSTTTSPISLGGTASDPDGASDVTSVTWSNDRGGSGIASGTTSWTVNGITLYSGTNVLTVTVHDAGGLTGTDTLAVTYTPPNNAPSVTITSPTSSSTYSTTSSTISLGGTASDPDGASDVTSVTWSNDRGGSGTASGTTSWTISGIPLYSGTNVITVTAHDHGGLTGTDVITVTYTPPNHPPAVTITSPTSSPTYSTTISSINLGGTASDPDGASDISSVTWSVDRGGSGSASGTTSWSISGITLYSGANIITVTAHDNGGLTGTDVITVTYTPPNHPPVVTITSPTSSPTYSTTTSPISLGGTASDPDGASDISSATWSNDRGGSGTASGTTSWSVSGIPLLSGTNVITVTAHDGGGLTGTDVITVTYAPPNNVPSVAITSPTSNPTYSTNSSSISLGGSASGSSAISSVTWSNAATGSSGTASGTTSWNINGISLNSGSNAITVTATDVAGRTGSDTVTVTHTPKGGLAVDGSASPTSGSASLSVSFTCTPTGGTAPYTYSWDFGDGGTSSSQSPSHTYTSAGTYHVKVTVTDPGSRCGNWTTSITVSSPSGSSATGPGVDPLVIAGIVGAAIVVFAAAAILKVTRAKKR